MTGRSTPIATIVPGSGRPDADAGLALVVEALGRIRFGDIRLTIHEGRLVQVDVTEKNRISHG